MPLDKDRADGFTVPLCSFFWFSKARRFNKSVPFNAQGLNPPGGGNKDMFKKRVKKVLSSFDFSLIPCVFFPVFFNEEDR